MSETYMNQANEKRKQEKIKRLQKYLALSKTHTEIEIAKILKINPRTVRDYAQQTGIKPKTNAFKNRTLSEWSDLFNKTFNDKLSITNIYRDNGKVFGDISSISTWQAENKKT